MRDIDPDKTRDGAICDGVPEAYWRYGYELTRPERPSPETEVARLRARIGRLGVRLAELDPEHGVVRELAKIVTDATGQTDIDKLRETCRGLEKRIGAALRISA